MSVEVLISPLYTTIAEAKACNVRRPCLFLTTLIIREIRFGSECKAIQLWKTEAVILTPTLKSGSLKIAVVDGMAGK